MEPLKLMRQRSYVLAADQVFNLSSVEVESPSSHSTAKLGPSPLSLCSARVPTAIISDGNAMSQQRAHGRVFMWRQRIEDCLWLASALFILYYGDFRYDFFTVLANDARVRRIPFHMGLVCLMVDSCMMMVYIVAGMAGQQQQEEHSGRKLLQATGVIQAVVLLGSLAFILLSLALWPIWNFLTIPMLFTLFMAITVVLPYVLPPDTKVLKLDAGSTT